MLKVKSVAMADSHIPLKHVLFGVVAQGTTLAPLSSHAIPISTQLGTSLDIVYKVTFIND
jgi:hypothetical protein